MSDDKTYCYIPAVREDAQFRTYLRVVTPGIGHIPPVKNSMSPQPQLNTQADYAPAEKQSFQSRVFNWVLGAFGWEKAYSLKERNYRFLEEVIELVQANGLTKEEVLAMVDYTYGRPVGEIDSEIGGVATTFNALCAAYGKNREVIEERELKSCWERIDKIRAKQAAKPAAVAVHEVVPPPRGGINPFGEGTPAGWTLRGRCTCDCHRMANVHHVMPCCSPQKPVNYYGTELPTIFDFPVNSKAPE